MPKGKFTAFAETVCSVSDVLDAAISVGGNAAGLIPTHRQCSIEITNKCSNYTLRNPSLHTDSGSCTEPLPGTSIDPSKTGNALFTKTPNTARGAVGVFTYNLLNQSANASTEKIAVMFSVPYDYNLYSNWYAVGIFDKSVLCDHDLYYQMYNNTGTFERKKGGQSIEYRKDNVTIIATMTDTFQPVMHVEVKDN
ncbi:LOW QUALITY PROTEIN: bryoporin-like [Morone saxatilis]|uniref:LOW QUALITY PROTEIN: bryoporin-like n=1 Tax=Morone saxatilis TaxID=34816 RepID=UPI0015E245C2|nr:LOW QUALITY PROTEIN: bryoporin-like [Morone saxatilis]